MIPFRTALRLTGHSEKELVRTKTLKGSFWKKLKFLEETRLTLS